MGIIIDTNPEFSYEIVLANAYANWLHDRNELDAEQEWEGMPEFNQPDKMPYRQIIISFDKESDVQDFANIMNENITEKTKSFWFPKKQKNILKDKAYVDES